MKRLILVSLLVLASAVAQASSLRIDGHLIREGSSVMDLIGALGGPVYKETVYECPNGCAPNYEIWMYRVKNLNYEFDIRGGRVEEIRWSRF